MSKKALSVKQIIDVLDAHAPKSLAMGKDPIGLMIGQTDRSANKVLVSLDVTEAVVDEAIDKNAQLIIAHHPLLFMPLQSIDIATPKGKVIEKCIKHDIAVYAAHTNLDIAKGGVNDLLAEKLELHDLQVLVQTDEQKLQKLVVFVPEEDAEHVRKKIGDAGAGHIGEYSHCSFSSQGTGAFLPGEKTNPHIGEQGQMTKVSEERIETVVPTDRLRDVLSALEKAHPYEEVAYDLYPLKLAGEPIGLGRIGKLKETVTLQAFAEHVKKVFDVKGLRVVGDTSKEVKTVAVLGGDGNNYWQTALAKGADVFVTGDLKFHTAQDAELEGLLMVDPGHHIEQVMKAGLSLQLQEQCSKLELEVTFLPSQLNTDPFTFI